MFRYQIVKNVYEHFKGKLFFFLFELTIGTDFQNDSCFRTQQLHLYQYSCKFSFQHKHFWSVAHFYLVSQILDAISCSSVVNPITLKAIIEGMSNIKQLFLKTVQITPRQFEIAECLPQHSFFLKSLKMYWKLQVC